jgi:hypothetical protein
MVVVVAVETVVLVLLAVLVAGLLRSHAEILRRLHQLGAGLDDQEHSTVEAPLVLRPRSVRPDASTGSLGPAHDVGGAGLHDDAVIVPVVGVQHRTLLAFLSSGCLTCRTFWQALDDPAAVDVVGDDVRVVIVAKDASEESLAELRNLAPRDVPVVLASDVWRAYEVPGSPYFVMVDGPSRRVLGEGTGVSWEQVCTLMLQAAADGPTSGDAREVRIDRELLGQGIEPGDESLYRTADEIVRRA